MPVELARAWQIALAVQRSQIGLETLKLLVQVAWADHEVAEEESAYILSLARQLDANSDELQSLERALADEGRLPAPNLTMLRGHYNDVMSSIDQLIHIDHKIVNDERAVRDAVAHLLTKP